MNQVHLACYRTGSALNAELALSSSQSVFGSVALLTNVNRKSCEDMLRHFRKSSVPDDRRIRQVLTSFGGTELLKSQVLPHVDSSESHIELFHYLVIEDKGAGAGGLFAEIVYEETLKLIRSTGRTLHFQQLAIEEMFIDEFTADYVWERPDILLYKAKLLK